MLEGTEVKALRESGAQLKDGYAAIRDGELWLHSVHIPPYGPASRENHEPERPRKLLLHRRELDRLAAQVAERGLTLVPTRIYFSGSHAKVEIALARGKDLYDKRKTIRERETKRDMERGRARSAALAIDAEGSCAARGEDVRFAHPEHEQRRSGRRRRRPRAAGYEARRGSRRPARASAFCAASSGDRSGSRRRAR